MTGDGLWTYPEHEVGDVPVLRSSVAEGVEVGLEQRHGALEGDHAALEHHHLRGREEGGAGDEGKGEGCGWACVL